MDALSALAERWREDAERFDEYGAAELARSCRLHADDLEAAVRIAGEEALSLDEGAAESGYSKRRLRELIAEGTIANAGRKHAPLILRRDLPKKPGSANAGDGGFDVHSTVRRLVS